MSVGHIARGLEEAGLATVIVAAVSFAPRMKMMSLPRVLLTDNLLGRVFGAPMDSASHTAILQRALNLLVDAKSNGSLLMPD